MRGCSEAAGFPNYLILLNIITLLSCVPLVASGRAERFGAKKEAKKHLFTDQPTFLARKASNHSLNPSPISGKGLNQEVAEADDFLTVLVSRDTR